MRTEQRRKQQPPSFLMGSTFSEERRKKDKRREMAVRVYVQRSFDGQILYFRRQPREFWQMKVDAINGSHYMFTTLEPGEGRYYDITPAPPPAEPKARARK